MTVQIFICPFTYRLAPATCAGGMHTEAQPKRIASSHRARISAAVQSVRRSVWSQRARMSFISMMFCLSFLLMSASYHTRAKETRHFVPGE